MQKNQISKKFFDKSESKLKHSKNQIKHPEIHKMNCYKKPLSFWINSNTQ